MYWFWLASLYGRAWSSSPTTRLLLLLLLPPLALTTWRRFQRLSPLVKAASTAQQVFASVT